MEFLCECQENLSCGNPVLNSESWVAQLRRMEDAGVGLEHLLGSEFARNCWVGVQRHHDGGCG